MSFFTFMHCVVWLSFLQLTVPHHIAGSLQPLCHDNERFTLLQFKESLTIEPSASSNSSAYPKMSSWKLEDNGHDCCFWDGIECNEDSGHVIKLDLTSSCLYGSIDSNSSLFDLVHLEWLSLADNDFNQSEILSTIIKLSKLSHLNLSSSGLVGKIPDDILNLTQLVSLDLRGVLISSSIPHVMENLSSLTHLSLESCGLQGVFPIEIFRLPNLYFLNVASNQELRGYLPEFQESSPLTELNLADTGFQGKIPHSIGNLTKLVNLDLSSIVFSGELPASIGNLAPNLKYLNLHNANLSGQLPSSLSNLTQLTVLDLSFNDFQSSSLSLFSKLTKLHTLSLSGVNSFREIPCSLMNLTQVHEIYLGVNQLSGLIPPCLMNLNQVEVLELMYNQLRGPIPSEIGNLTRLTSLSLGSNQLEGMIPNSIFELGNLRHLLLCKNNIIGIIELDTFLLKLKKLVVLDLSSNNLSVLAKTSVTIDSQQFLRLGLRSSNVNIFPNFLKNQKQLVMLDLSSNSISGQIPRWLLNVSVNSLTYLNLSHNFLTNFDQHPIFLPWTQLLTLDLNSNQLQGPLPVPPLSIITYIISYNNLTGNIPLSICNSNNLSILDLSYNNFSSMLLECLGSFPYLSVLQLESNKFHGNIPSTFINGTNLKMIDLSNNFFQGKIPRSLANCTMLEFLDLGNNQMSDVFPSWLGSLTELRVLILQSNKFHGEIHKSQTALNFPRLRIIDLSHNMFTGALPSKYFKCWNAMNIVNQSQITYMQENIALTSCSFVNHKASYAYSLTMSNKGIKIKYGKVSNMLTSINLSNNRFTGEIPASIAKLKGLRMLNLSNNNLQGHIPSSLGELTVLESLDLSKNMLSGKIPQQLAELTFLAFLNVSNNHLTGSIPQGKQFNTFENGSFDGNTGLCGKPFSRACEISDETREEEIHQGSASLVELIDWKIVAIGCASGLITGVVLGHIFYETKVKWFLMIFGRHSKKMKIKRSGS